MSEKQILYNEIARIQAEKKKVESEKKKLCKENKRLKKERKIQDAEWKTLIKLLIQRTIPTGIGDRRVLSKSRGLVDRK